MSKVKVNPIYYIYFLMIMVLFPTALHERNNSIIVLKFHRFTLDLFNFTLNPKIMLLNISRG